MVQKHGVLKAENLKTVLEQIIYNGPIDRTEIARKTQLAGATVSRMTRTLVEEGLVVETTVPSPDRPGRRNIMLDLCPKGGVVIGLSINAYEQIISLANLKNEVLISKSLDLDPMSSAVENIDIICASIKGLIEEKHIKKQKILGVAAAVAGSVDNGTGMVRYARVLGWENIDLASHIKEQLDLPLFLENLPAAVNLCEASFGKTRGLKNVVLLNMALSIGMSMLLDHKLVNNSYMIGALPFIEGPGGVHCKAENVAAGWSLLYSSQGNRTQAYETLPGKRLNALLEQERTHQDYELQQLVYKIGLSAGRLCELVAGILQPEALVISGPMARNATYFGAIQDYLKGSPVFQNADIQLHLSTISANEATRSAALQYFLLG